MKLYGLGKVVSKLYFNLFYKIEILGKENIPEHGGVLLCSNHHSNLDPPLIGSSSSRELSFMAKKELFDVPVFGPIIKRCNAFPIKRGGSDRQAIKLALSLLKDNRTLLMFPEGSRNKSGELAAGLSGAGFFSLKTDAAVIPCAIIGSYKLFHKMRIVFGPPIDFTELKDRKAKPLEASQLIMKHIRKVIEENKF